MLAELFGSQTSKKCLLYLASQGAGNSYEVEKTFKTSNTQVLRTLHKLEQADLLVGREMGRARK
jgi:predicted transcriptional regulator